MEKERSEIIDLPLVVAPPNYATLISWWDAWPKAKPAHLDFWARGNYIRRLISRKNTNRAACIVRVEYIDEIEAALRKLALLDLDVDFIWHGEISKPQLNILPQDIDYEDSGGWGYSACAGDRMKDNRGGKEWCPSTGWGALLPDSLTDWLNDEAQGFLNDGRIMVAPAGHVGLRKIPGGKSENQLQRVSNSISMTNEKAKIRALFNLELPFVEGLPLRDVYKFCRDHGDSLTLFQGALRKFFQTSLQGTEESISQQLLNEINENVAELRLSDRTLGTRKTLSALGATISTLLVTVGIKLGFSPSAAAVGSTGAAIAAITQISQIIEARGQMRKNPYYAIWALQKGKGPKNIFKHHQSLRWAPPTPERSQKEIPPFHWLSPPTAGWRIPTVLRGN
jgi:hypothetical protein